MKFAKYGSSLGDVDDFIANCTSWCLVAKLISLSLPMHSFADRRLKRDLVIRNVYFFGTYDLVSPILCITFFLDSDGRTDISLFSMMKLDDLSGNKDRLDLFDAIFHLCLIASGLLIFSVLGKIAERLGIFKAFRDFLAADGLEGIKLFGQFVEFFLGQILLLVNGNRL